MPELPEVEIVRRERIEALLRRTERPNSESKFLFTLLTVRLFLDMYL